MKQEITNELNNSLVKTTPPVGVAVTSICGVSLSDWVYIFTIMYLIIQTVFLVVKTLNMLKDNDNANEEQEIKEKEELESCHID